MSPINWLEIEGRVLHPNGICCQDLYRQPKTADLGWPKKKVQARQPSATIDKSGPEMLLFCIQ